MCGISALFQKLPTNMNAQLRRSLDLIRHRGPDGRCIVWGLDKSSIIQGEEYEGAFFWALGHVRLAILDTSAHGSQPMSVRNESVWITYNGEIYNYIELKAELEQIGHQFKTGTDTEVILASYVQWGEHCLERFVGMFAFVLVDLEKRRVFCARDRLGVKPLYFWQSCIGTFIFSEPKQLKAFPSFTFRANRQQLLDFIVDNVANHVANESMLEGVIPLMPGHYISWNLDEAVVDLADAKRYWHMPVQVEACSWPDAVERLRAALVDAIRIRLRSDVPVGSCLSGGLDSSSIVGIASHDFGANMHTFSACFDGYRFDEQYYMDAVNRHCNSTASKVFPSGSSFAQELEAVVYHQDEPFLGTSIYSQWCVMRAAREHGIPVLLDGQGGDEALCGYRKYSFFYLKQLIQKHRYGAAVRHASMMFLNGDRQLFKFNQGQRYLPRFLRKNTKWIEDLLRPQIMHLHRNIWQHCNKMNRSLKDFQRDDLARWSLPILLRYEDRNSMAHSVESRVPFIDHRFIELCLSLPDDLFFRDGKSKRLLTCAMGGRLPEVVHNRRDKYGFSTPLEQWLIGKLGCVLEQEIMQSKLLNEIIDITQLQELFRAFRRGSRVVQISNLFPLGCVATWMRIFDVQW